MGNLAFVVWYENYGEYVHHHIKDGWYDLIYMLADVR